MSIRVLDTETTCNYKVSLPHFYSLSACKTNHNKRTNKQFLFNYYNAIIIAPSFFVPARAVNWKQFYSDKLGITISSDINAALQEATV